MLERVIKQNEEILGLLRNILILLEPETMVPKNTAVKNGFSVPTIDDIKEYCHGRRNLVDATRFFNFYAAKGWMIGKNRMKDWRAAIRTWEAESGFRNDPKTNLCRCRRDGYYPTVISRDAKTLICLECRDQEMIEDGE